MTVIEHPRLADRRRRVELERRVAAFRAELAAFDQSLARVADLLEAYSQRVDHAREIVSAPKADHLAAGDVAGGRLSERSHVDMRIQWAIDMRDVHIAPPLFRIEGARDQVQYFLEVDGQPVSHVSWFDLDAGQYEIFVEPLQVDPQQPDRFLTRILDGALAVKIGPMP